MSGKIIASISIVVCSAILAFAVASLVSAHGGDQTKIHSCVNSGSGTIKIVQAGESCKSGWVSLDWSQEGAEGPEGPEGPAGQQGPKGDKGDAGTSSGLASIQDLAGLPCSVGGQTGEIQLGVTPATGVSGLLGTFALNCVDSDGPPPCEGDACIDLQTDVRNCGSLGNDLTMIEHTTMACVGGIAAIAGCSSGWFDKNGSALDGCEAQDFDSDGWTTDMGDCDDTNANVRPGAAEVANGIDDDCDLAIDEGIGGATLSVSGVGFSPATITVGAGTLFTVSLNNPAPEDVVVALTYQHGFVPPVSGPATLTILEGQVSGFVEIIGVADGTATVTAEYGASSKSATMTVN